MNEFDMQIHSSNRQHDLRHEGEQWRLAQSSQQGTARNTPILTETNIHIPPLARLGEILIELGEGLKARYGEALDNLPAASADVHPKSV